jgi:hypothetical protein
MHNIHYKNGKINEKIQSIDKTPFLKLGFDFPKYFSKSLIESPCAL